MLPKFTPHAQRGVKIFHLNVFGLLNKIPEISLFFNEHNKTDFFTLSETHIIENDHNDVDGLYEVPGVPVHPSRQKGK